MTVVIAVAAGVSKPGKVDAGPAAGDSKCWPGTYAVTSPLRSAQIKHAVSVHTFTRGL